MIVYIVKYGFVYEDCMIAGVYSSESKTKKAIDFLKKSGEDGYDYYIIHEYEVDGEPQ